MIIARNIIVRNKIVPVKLPTSVERLSMPIVAGYVHVFLESAQDITRVKIIHERAIVAERIAPRAIRILATHDKINRGPTGTDQFLLIRNRRNSRQKRGAKN